MHDPSKQIEDVNHYDNTVVVKFEDGQIALLNGSAVRQANDALQARRVIALDLPVVQEKGDLPEFS